MEDQPRILVVEDDRRLARMLAEILESEGYDVTAAYDGRQALHEGLTRQFDVLLLDRRLPAIEGLDVLARPRGRGVLTPALVLSALGNPSDRVEGLDRGAEDYLAKPFDMDELLARLRALRRRNIERVPMLPVPGGLFDTAGRTVTASSGAVVQLSEREAALLEVLARHPGRIYPRIELLDLVFPDADDDGVVDTYVHYLRRKLGRAAVMTVRGVGYRLGRQE